MKKYVLFLLLALLFTGAGCLSSPPASPIAIEPPPTTSKTQTTESYLTFSLNMQDFQYPEKSAEVLRKALSLHEKYHVPVDVFLTGTIAKYYAEQAPDLIEQLKNSPLVAISYHVRPPAPYTNDFDWAGLGDMSTLEQYETIMDYETHDIDLVNGTPTSESGGYQYVKDAIGYAPYAAGVPSSAGLTASTDKVMKDLGAVMDIVHSDSAINIGEKKNDLWIRPETVDLRLFEKTGTGGDAIDEALATAPNAPNAQAPYFVNVKMHDNDFFAENSAWTTVYLAKGFHRQPPFDLSLHADLLSETQQAAVWTRYEQALKRASELIDTKRIYIPDILQLEP